MPAIDELKEALKDIVFTDEDTLFRGSFDAMKLSSIPEAVVKPTEEEQVGKMLKLANEHAVAVTCRGAGSSLTGSASPAKPGGWVLDLSGLTSIKIDPLNKFAYVGAGVTTETVQQFALGHGLFYPPDPSSRKYCTIGGNIACNAGGLRGVKYGVTRDYVIALRGYLASGEAVSWGLPLKKFASGYNLRDLWVGSEGTLGVVTHAVLKLLPKPKYTWSCLANFGSEEKAIEASQKILESGLVPSALEFLDTLTVSGAQKALGRGLFESNEPHCLLIIEADGDEIESQKAGVLKIVQGMAKNYIEAETEEDARPFWEFRRECSSAMFQHGNAKLNEDVVVPLLRLRDLIKFISKLSENSGLKLPTFGHVGDGNLHVNIMYNRENEVQCERAENALNSLMKKVIELGGAITGEHGVGLAKSPFFHLQHTEPEVQAMLAIKKALDPKGILNPGKIFESFEVWKHKPVEVRLPWDHD